MSNSESQKKLAQLHMYFGKYQKKILSCHIIISHHITFFNCFVERSFNGFYHIIEFLKKWQGRSLWWSKIVGFSNESVRCFWRVWVTSKGLITLGIFIPGGTFLWLHKRFHPGMKIWGYISHSFSHLFILFCFVSIEIPFRKSILDL